ncbi:MAG: DUF6390 family protein [Actinomycetota bacterium]|nr:DUF6390 family protein [Actinomycetota bacterium]
MPAGISTAAGEAMFARYAYPPNELGYCGPGDGHELLQFAFGAAGGAGTRSENHFDMSGRARAFDGAWPYLEHLAATAGSDSPMDRRVVEAYWVGNDLLEAADPAQFAAAAAAAFAGQAWADWAALTPHHSPTPVPVPHHSFHVFVVYPWVGVLRRTGEAKALEVLDRCRIRWGRVEAVDGDVARVQYEPLTWNGTAFGLGAPRSETARIAAGGRSLLDPPRPGEWVALHWDWVCDRLDPDQLRALKKYTARQLAITNRPG